MWKTEIEVEGAVDVEREREREFGFWNRLGSALLLLILTK
jgi:hypothetical protein